MQNVEVRYLNIQWADPNTVLKVEESDQPIELELTKGRWHGQTITYPTKHFYIGICVDGQLLYTPHFILQSNDQEPLKAIKVPGSSKVWWIQNGKWDKKSKRFLSEMYRTAGHIEISVQDSKILLDNNTVNFSVEELEYYLSDLKDNLWMLILDGNSAAKANVERPTPDVFSSEIIQLFENLASSIEAITQNPNIILSETQQQRPRRFVKPVPKTFREIATRSNPKLLTSRAYEESFDTPENRYIHYLAKSSFYLLKVLSRLADMQKASLHEKISMDKEWLENDSGQKRKKVDPIVYDNEITAISTDAIEDERNLTAAINSQESGYVAPETKSLSYVVNLGNRYGQAVDRYFVQCLDGNDFKEKYQTYLVLSSQIDFRSALNASNLSDYKLRITGTGTKTRERNAKSNMFYNVSFQKIHSIDILFSPLNKEVDRLRIRREELTANDWWSELSKEELDGIRNHSNTLKKRLNLFDAALLRLDDFGSDMPALTSRFKKVVHFFKERRVKIQHESPNSMVFVQNPLYSTAKSIFRKIGKVEAMDDSLLSSLMQVDQIGLVNLPNLYERWCLLQIVNILNNIYKFELEEGWQHRLIDAVLNNGKDIEINFKSHERQLALKLTYEKTLDSGKRPDYVIDLNYFSYEYKSSHRLVSSTQKESSESPPKWLVSGKFKERLVLDAKYRGDVKEAHIKSLVDELYDKKNYSENGKNAVFVIHPVASITRERTSPLEWGRYCDYGQSDNIYHKKGAVYVSPSRQHSNSSDNLQRLLGMFLQSHTVVLDSKERKRVNWHNKCCISCGNQDLDIQLTTTKDGNKVNKIACRSCGLHTTETLCISCHVPIYKNGYTWTYHRTRAEQTTNIVCPNCEAFL